MILVPSLVIAALVALPWLLEKEKVPAAIAAAVSFLVSSLLIYLCLPSSAGPLFGGFGDIAVVLLVISAVVAAFSDARVPGYSGFLALVVWLFIAIGNSTLFQATNYSRLVPQVTQRQWSTDFQAKDPKHFRVSSVENAGYLAKRAMGQATTVNQNGTANAIGSQFSASDDAQSVQIINGELWTVVTLDWSGFGPWSSGYAKGVPGYIKVSAENPNVPAHYVALKDGAQFRYTPGAFFGDNLDRLVWRHQVSKYIVDKHLEINEEGDPFYIVSLAEPTIGWWGEKVTGVVIVDPVTGAGAEKFIPVGQVPSWVDRVEAMDIVHRNIDLHGKYAQGLMNKIAWGNSVLKATQTHFGYGSDGQPVFATGITAHGAGGSSDSLVAVYYTNTRTGETTEYMLNGGATEERAIEQCDLLGDVKNKGYHATTPQLYNVYGTLSYVCPLQNKTHAFAGVAIVAVMNPQVIAWGPNPHEAVIAYQQVISSNGSPMSIDNARKLSEVTGKVARIGQTVSAGASIFFVMVEGQQHLFTVPLTASVKVPLTQAGDTVWIKYIDSGETMLPVDAFDNRSFTLNSSKGEQEVLARAEAHKEQGRDVMTGDRNPGATNVLNELSPEQRQKVEALLTKPVAAPGNRATN